MITFFKGENRIVELEYQEYECRGWFHDPYDSLELGDILEKGKYIITIFGEFYDNEGNYYSINETTVPFTISDPHHVIINLKDEWVQQGQVTQGI